ncbi:MAG: epoxyqueuosine reductase QueH [Coriobacteriia bacterium]|nr:epoxyqueuosine reductase QueH [Coriobacteriia bacterium]
MRLLLHACCGPCLIEPYDAMSHEYETDVLFANPNIHPAGEWVRRRDTLLDYAGAHGLTVIEIPQDARSWSSATAGLEDDRSRRCRACFGLRMDLTARAAAAGSYDGFATTLTVSPYQDGDSIRDAGEEAARAHGVRYIHRDFRNRYHEATKRARDGGMYLQNYCGCMLSSLEATREREERRHLPARCGNELRTPAKRFDQAEEEPVTRENR